MSKLFWMVSGLGLPIEEQQDVELWLHDPPNAWGDSYIVSCRYYEWDPAQRKTVPALWIVDRTSSLEMAQARYDVRLRMLAEQGFV